MFKQIVRRNSNNGFKISLSPILIVKKGSKMSSEDTKISAEVIVDAVLSSVKREMEDGHGSSSEFESISSSPELHKVVLLM